MKNNYLYLVLFLSVGHLSAQQLYQHPVLLLLGTDLAEMRDAGTGLNAYDGLGKMVLLQGQSWQESPKISLSWVPLNGLPNGWGLLERQPNSGRYLSVSGSEKEDYEVAAKLSWNSRKLGQQNTVLQISGNQRLADHNSDGFRDQIAHSTYNLQHQFSKQVNSINLSGYFQYFGQRQHGGELDYDWKQQAGSDRIYGFGSKLNQWIGGASAQHTFREGRDLRVNVNWRLHQENAVYGQRILTAQERRSGLAINYHQEHARGQSHLFSYYQHQRVEQDWDDWSFDPSWNKLAFGGLHRRFLTSKWLVEGSFAIDYHSASRWQLLPNLRFDYLPHKKIRLGALAGKDYRWQHPLTALQPYLVSQRQWLSESYGPDRLWYLGGLLQTKQVRVGNCDLNFKVVYQARLLTEQLVADPSQAGELTIYHRSAQSPWQHLLLLTTQAKVGAFNTSLVYRWRDKPQVLSDSTGQAFFESRHSLLAQVSYQKEIYRNLQRIKFATDYLLRSPQRLPNEEISPYLHNWRCQLDLQWRNIKKTAFWPTSFFGVENLLDQQQDRLYTAADTPFSTNFDGSNRWGNPVGRRWYAGLRIGF